MQRNWSVLILLKWRKYAGKHFWSFRLSTSTFEKDMIYSCEFHQLSYHGESNIYGMNFLPVDKVCLWWLRLLKLLFEETQEMQIHSPCREFRYFFSCHIIKGCVLTKYWKSGCSDFSVNACVLLYRVVVFDATFPSRNDFLNDVGFRVRS